MTCEHHMTFTYSCLNKELISKLNSKIIIIKVISSKIGLTRQLASI